MNRFSFIKLVAGLGVALAVSAPLVFAAEPAVVIPAPSYDVAKNAGPLQKAVFAGGCFWGVQGVYQHVKGVRNVVSGYAGGDRSTAEYEVVSTGRTGHAESVEITYDPKEVTYGELLQIFFSVVHDPTQLNRQGPDHGTQYRSAIFYGDEGQKKLALDYIAQLDKTKKFDGPIVTQVVPNKAFYPAESYHQDFLVNNPRHGYIVYNDLPKVRNLKQIFPQVWRDDPVLVASARTTSR
jgi:peptide-methionine (S)-S-oxide reductase